MAKKRVVAVDIGTHIAKMVQLEQSSAGVRLINAGVVTYANRDDRQQMAALMQNLWSTLGKPPKQGNLNSLFNRHKTEVVLALPRSLVNTKRLANLPAATDDQLANIVEIAAEAELPFRIEEAIFTYHDIHQTSEATSVELISTRRASVTGYLDILEQIGVSASGVTPSMIAIAEAAMNSGSTEPTFIVDIGAAQTDFCFLEDGALRFSRSFRLGGDNLSEHVSRALNVDPETAAQEKQHISAGEAPTSAWTAELISELQRSIAAATAHRDTDSFGTAEETDILGGTTRSEAKTELWLCGGGARVPDLATVLEAELDIPTYLWNPLHTIEQQAAIKIDPERTEAKAILDEWGDTLAVPLGVGLATLNPETQISLLPKEAAETLTQTTRQQQIFATTGLGILVIGGLLFGGYTLQRSQKHRTEMVEAQLAGYAQPVAAAKAQLGRELALTEMLAHNISPLDILHALSEMFRDRTQVAWTNFNITNLHTPETARITFNLEGASHNAINNLLGALDRSGVFTNVRPGEVTTISQNRKQIFQVQVRCNLKSSAVRAFAKKRYPMPDPQVDEPERQTEFSVAPPTSNNFENEKVEKEE
ncbi:MAG: pilus assembly protein PilM [Candidatus Poribacteria bacterium]|nr:pilus assembly protein PilM [Candidatus Poribacteria bacterium]